MDFGQILHTAQKNDKSTNNGIRYYSTKFEPPKKQKKTTTELSVNVKKFLERQEAEAKKKAEEERKRREELLALRSKDKKATRRVNVMLKRTKSANQSVLDDAIDDDNTAVTLAGPMQPDEDDYGYVSQEASTYYNQMMEKYNKMPDEPKFDMSKKKVSTNLGSTKERVKAALEREREEAMMPHKRKRKIKEGDKKNEEDDEGLNFEAPERPVKREGSASPPRPPKPKPRPAPPPMNFTELLKIAAQKQHEPIVIEKKEKEEEVLLTKKQRKELEREKQLRLRLEEMRRERDNQMKEQKMNRIPKIGEQNSKSTTSNSQTNSNGERSTFDRIPKIPSITNKSNGEKRLSDSRGYSSSEKNSISSKSNDNRHISSPSNMDRSSDPKPKYSSEESKLKKALKSPESHSSTARKLPNDIVAKKSSGSDSSTQRKSSNDVRAKTSSKLSIQEEVPQKKYLPGDIRAKGQLQEEKKSRPGDEPRKYLPGDIRAKSSSDDAPQRKYLPGDIRANSATQNGQKQGVSGGTKLQNPPRNDPISRKSSDIRKVEEHKFKIPDSKKPIAKSSSVDSNRSKIEDTRRSQISSADIKPRKFPPDDVRPRQFPPPDVRRREPPNKKKQLVASKRRILDEDDSEYDSEMDDFIDDDDVEDDYSKYITEIFGYDKSKYRDMDDDIDQMESSFAQQMREEVISTKLGIMEDLEDMRKEEEEKKRKMMMKKKRRLN